MSVLLEAMKLSPNSSALIVLVFSLVALPLIAAENTQPAAGVKKVGVEEFDKLRKEKDTVVLDVRTPREYKAGHIPGAVNLDYNAGDFSEKVSKLDKSKTYLVHCAAGRRSAGACNLMTKMAFTNLVDLEPGFRAWEKAGKPVEK